MVTEQLLFTYVVREKPSIRGCAVLPKNAHAAPGSPPMTREGSPGLVHSQRAGAFTSHRRLTKSQSRPPARVARALSFSSSSSGAPGPVTAASLLRCPAAPASCMRASSADKDAVRLGNGLPAQGALPVGLGDAPFTAAKVATRQEDMRPTTLQADDAHVVGAPTA